MTAEGLARARRIAAALADELVEPDLSSVGDRHHLGVLECPGCGSPGLLPVRRSDALSMLQCDRCGGAWLGVGDLEQIADDHTPTVNRPPVDRRRLRHEVRAMTGDAAEVEYRSCPRCRDVMRRKNFGETSGVMIDECPDHGVFLDAGELEAIQHFVAKGGLAWARELDEARRASAELRADRRRKLEAAEQVREALNRGRWRQSFWVGLW